tara:strand:- start:71 stop:745 length:675 start_codon:yes stop_codon:yes gene_type:complete
MEIYPIDVYRSPNIGVFIEANENYLLVPYGFALTKVKKISSVLNVDFIPTSIGDSRLIGSLLAMNNNGIVVSRLMSYAEISSLSKKTGLNVSKLDSKYTALGNLVVANDKGGLISPLLSKQDSKLVSDILGVPLESMTVASYDLVGSVVAATNSGAIVHPEALDSELEQINSILRVKASLGTINGGVPFVSSGIVANSKSLIVGSLTSGPELMMLSQTFEGYLT